MNVTFDFAQKLVRIEGDGPELATLLQLVRDIAPKLTEINIVTEPAPGPSGEGASNGEYNKPVPPREPGWQTLREFARSLAPSNLAEKIVAIGYYVGRYEGKASFSAKDMGEWFTLCGFEKPSQMAVALFDAKRKYGYLEKMGYGDWRLTTAGENVVIRKLGESQI